jgi:hypothetical protein
VRLRTLGLLSVLGILAGCIGTSEADAQTAGDLTNDDYATYAQFAEAHGLPVQADRALAIGIRGRDRAGGRHPTEVKQAYDDTLVVLTPDHRVLVLSVSTHPWETGNAEAAPDVNGDGETDVGMIRPGIYLATERASSGDIAGNHTYRVTTASGDDRLPGYRNTDHDTTYSEAERDASTARGDVLTAVLFHQAGVGAPALIGCQGLAANEMRQLVSVAGARFDYLLVDANMEQVP